jgi:hypothetical protein
MLGTIAYMVLRRTNSRFMICIALVLLGWKVYRRAYRRYRSHDGYELGQVKVSKQYIYRYNVLHQHVNT